MKINFLVGSLMLRNNKTGVHLFYENLFGKCVQYNEFELVLSVYERFDSLRKRYNGVVPHGKLLSCSHRLARIFMYFLPAEFFFRGADVYICDGLIPFTFKIRIVGGHQQMIRLDFEEANPVAHDVARELVAKARDTLDSGVDAIILSDYGKGVCTDELCQQIISLGSDKGIPVLVDPKGDEWEKYRGALYITPNVKETGVVTKRKLKNETEILRDAATFIKEKYGIKNVMITRSEKGISLFSEDAEMHMPTVAREVFDVSGAGDTVIATFVAGIVGGLDLGSALCMANIAAGIGVGKFGTYSVSKEDILGEFRVQAPPT